MASDEDYKWSITAWPGTDLVQLKNNVGDDLTVRLSKLRFIGLEDDTGAIEGLHTFEVDGSGFGYRVRDSIKESMIFELRVRWSDFLAGRGTAFSTTQEAAAKAQEPPA